MPPFNVRTGIKAQTSPRQNIQRAHRDTAKPFTALGRNQGRSLGFPSSRGRDYSETARQIPTSNSRTGVKAKTSPGQEVQRARRDSTRVFRAPGISEGRSSSQPSTGGRNFSGGLPGGSKGFSGKFSRKLPDAGSALKGYLRVPF
jgi:hypothetical protein